MRSETWKRPSDCIERRCTSAQQVTRSAPQHSGPWEGCSSITHHFRVMCYRGSIGELCRSGLCSIRLFLTSHLPNISVGMQPIGVSPRMSCSKKEPMHQQLPLPIVFSLPLSGANRHVPWIKNPPSTRTPQHSHYWTLQSHKENHWRKDIQVSPVATDYLGPISLNWRPTRLHAR